MPLRETMTKIQSINPYTEEVLEEFDLMPPAALDAAVGSLRRSFSAWRELPAAARAAQVQKLGGHLRQARQRYAETITREMGKPIRESIAEIEKCAWLCDYYAEHAEQMLEREVIGTEASSSYVLFQPLGIVLAIMPWNFPFWQAFRFAVPAIIAGNVVALKHASSVPQCALAIEESFRAAGFPEGILKTLLISSGEALRLIDEDRVDAVSLTGSNKAGEQVAEHAGRRVRKVVLELGGSDPFIVLEDADIDQAAKVAVTARTINAGQSCIAAKRFIIVESVAKNFREAFLSHLRKLRLGDPMLETTDIGPLARKEILETLQAQLQDARDKGGEIIQAEFSAARGFFFPPAAVFKTKPGMRILAEEVFGPLAAVIMVRDEEEALRVANDTEYGLGASIWTRDSGRAELLATRIEAGCIAINDMVKSDPRLPFGGVKKSGIGRELSHFGLKEFVNIKTIVVRE